MQIATCRHSWLSKCFFLGLYFIFFAVQVHLQYSFPSPQEMASRAFVGKQPLSTSVFSASKYIASSKETRQGAKLNKRYYPAQVEFVPLQYKIQQEFISLQVQPLGLTPAIFSPLSACPLLRGPPVS